MSFLQCYLKPSDWCPLACRHCYLPRSVRADRHLMTVSVLDACRELLLSFCARMGIARVHILYHGGEPLLVPPHWYDVAAERLVAPLSRAGLHVEESLQTALLPFREEHVALVRERLSGSLGISVDFAPHRHVGGSSDRALAALERQIDAAHSHGISLSPTFVVGRGDAGRVPFILDWMSDHGFSHFQCERYNDFGVQVGHAPDPLRPTNAEHASFLGTLLDVSLARLASGRAVARAGPILSALGGVRHAVAGDRWGTDCARHFLVIGPRGELHTCPDRALHEPPYALAEEGVSAFLGGALRRRWIRYAALGHHDPLCDGCIERPWCRSGCPITEQTDAEISGGECAGYRTFLTHLRGVDSDPAHRALLDAYVASPVQ